MGTGAGRADPQTNNELSSADHDLEPLVFLFLFFYYFLTAAAFEEACGTGVRAPAGWLPLEHLNHCAPCASTSFLFSLFATVVIFHYFHHRASYVPKNKK
jgi:hypothetical protein